jgi:hypothetical protein
MNIMNEIQNNIKQWNHGWNYLQNQTPTESTTKIIQSYTNTNHKYLDHNSNNLNYKTCTIGWHKTIKWFTYQCEKYNSFLWRH